MEEGILSLKWNHHTSSFMQRLSTLHKVELYSDVTLACDGKYFPVHKLVLSVCSEYFEEILATIKCPHPVIVLKDIRHSDLEVLLNYMYSGEANVSQSELSLLIKAAECLKIKGLAVPDEPPSTRDKKRTNDSCKEEYTASKRRRRDDSSTQGRKSPKSNHQIFYSTNEEGSSDRLQDTTSSNLNENSGNQAKNFSEGHVVEIKEELEDPKPEPELQPPPLLEEYSLHNEDISEEGYHMLDPQCGNNLIGNSSAPGPSAISETEGVPWDSNFIDESYQLEDGTQQSNLLSGVYENERFGYRDRSKNVEFPSQRKWICSICGYHADRQSSLEKHVRKHTGEKPFSCSYCSYTCAQSSNLYSHMKTIHHNQIMACTKI